MAQKSSMERMESFRNPQSRLRPEIEQSYQTVRKAVRIPAIGYIGMALGSMVASALLASFARRKEFANFVGLWAPSFLLFGIYDKVSRLERPESYESQKKAA